jgi:hypothetical protein
MNTSDRMQRPIISQDEASVIVESAAVALEVWPTDDGVALTQKHESR